LWLPTRTTASATQLEPTEIAAQEPVLV
jgi:hypothetical protein